MLPGFRFLFIAVVLSVSMLVFGLGAAALLRATHEEFASLPLKQMPEVTFGTRPEAEPTLAVLQADTLAADLDQHDATPSQTADAPQTAPVTPETAAVFGPGKTDADKVAALTALTSTDDKSVVDAMPADADAKTAVASVTEPQAGNNAPAIVAGPATPVTPGPDIATAPGGMVVTPAADPAVSPASATQAVVGLDPGAAVSAEPKSAELKSVESTSVESKTGDSKPDEARAGDPKIVESKTTESKTTDVSTVTTSETGPDVTTGSVASEAAILPATTTAAETKPAVSDIAPQNAPADAASPTITAPGDATAKIAALSIPMPVERPKTIGKASSAIKPATKKKRIVKRRPLVRRARIVRPAKPQPANPFAASPFGSD